MNKKTYYSPPTKRAMIFKKGTEMFKRVRDEITNKVGCSRCAQNECQQCIESTDFRIHRPGMDIKLMNSFTLSKAACCYNTFHSSIYKIWDNAVLIILLGYSNRETLNILRVSRNIMTTNKL